MEKNSYETHGDITKLFIAYKNEVIEVLLDTIDAEKVKSHPFNWYARYDKKMGGFYIQSVDKMSRDRKVVHLHRFLTNAPKGFVVDHINHDTTDNRRENLRVITQAQNVQNKRGARADNKTSGIRGVSWKKANQKWQAAIGIEGKVIYLGLYDDIKEAEKAVIEARKKHMPYAV